MVVEADYDVGVTIRVSVFKGLGFILLINYSIILFNYFGGLQDKIIPRAVDWFLGQVDDDSDFDEYDINDEEL